jgi:DNA-binding response OmpR family regulator
MVEKTRILIVDDEPINLEFFDVMLSKLGFIVAMAEDGEEALEQVKSFNPDLIILDNVMPKMSGWQVTRIIKQDPLFEKYREIPIIMFSAMDDVKDKIEGFELGVEDYITKPFNFSEVLARIRAVIRGKELYRQVYHRDEEMASIAEIGSRLSAFVGITAPVMEKLIQRGQAVKSDDATSVGPFVKSVIADLSLILESMKNLEREVQEKVQPENGGKTVIQDLDRRFDNHFRRLKENVDSMGEVRD